MPAVGELARSRTFAASRTIALRFAGFWLAGFTLYGLLDQRLAALNEATARLFALSLRLLGFDAVAVGHAVIWEAGARSFVIIDECTGIFGLLLFTAIVLATPAANGRRLLGIGIGILAIAVINLIRLIILAFVYTFAPTAFPFVHEVIIQVFFIAAVVALFLAWLPRATPKT